MENINILLFTILIITLVLTISVYALNPQITIISPQNTTYNSTTVLLIVTTDVVSNTSYSLNSENTTPLFANSTNGFTNIVAQEGVNSLTVFAVNGVNQTNSTVYFTVDTTPPNVTLISPINSIDNPIVEFKFRASDQFLESMNCSLYVNNESKETKTVSNNTESSFSQKLVAGNYSWEINCEDNMKNVGSSETKNLEIETKCGLHVSDLEAEADKMKINVNNTGTVNQIVYFTFYSNLDKLVSNSTELNITEGKEIIYSHNFGHGTHNLEANITTDCGITEVKTLGYNKVQDYFYCSNPNGMDGDIKCNYTNRILSQCIDKKWLLYSSDSSSYCYSCSEHCGDGVLNCWETEETCPSDYTESLPEPHCGVDITDFDYVNEMREGQTAYLISKIKNTGEKNENITLNFYLDGESKGRYNFDLKPGNITTKTFQYSPTSGSHIIKINTSANCGSKDEETISIEVHEKTENIILPSTITSLVVNIDAQPEIINTQPGEQKAITIELKTTKPQIFNINVSGIPENWIEYKTPVGVIDKKTTYIYVTPEEYGQYNLTIYVNSLEDNHTFYTTLNVEEEVVQKLEIEYPTATGILVVIVVLIILGLGYKKLKRD